MTRPANYYTRRMTAYGAGVGLSVLTALLFHAALENVSGHANPLILLPAFGAQACWAIAAFFAMLWIATWIAWLKAGRPKSPF